MVYRLRSAACAGSALILVTLTLAPAADEKSSAPRAASPAGEASAFLEMGISQWSDGDLENALFSLETATRRLAMTRGRARDQASALVYQGAVNVALKREKDARGLFRKALALDAERRLDAGEFPANVLRVFEEERLSLAARRTRRQRNILLGAAAAVAGAGGAAIAVNARGETLPENRPPTVSIGQDPEGGAVAGITTIILTAQATDPDGDLLTYAWDLGDGTRSNEQALTHVYATEGAYTARVTVADTQGAKAEVGRQITVRSLAGRWQDPYDGPVCGSSPLIFTVSWDGRMFSGSAPSNSGPISLEVRIQDPLDLTFYRGSIPQPCPEGGPGTPGCCNCPICWAGARQCNGTVSRDLNEIHCGGEVVARRVE